MTCDMCGRQKPTKKALIEGTELSVCDHCSKYGKVLEQKQVKTKQVHHFEEPTEAIVNNFSERIRNARSEKGWTQKEFAIKIAEKESIVQKIESNHFTPRLETARKIEKALGIRLIEVMKEVEIKKNAPSQGMTIGDLLKK